ncbi:MAG: gliding motility-associated C-terminal domain-containing protein [Bacteroidia bacterium]
MKSTLTLFFLISFFPFQIIAQGENDEWIFGQNVHLSFKSGTATVIEDKNVINTLEGSTSVCDSKGKLLFYSDGLNVYDRYHQLLKNGDGLMGHKSSTSSAVVVPYPGKANTYYLFCVDQNLSHDNQGVTYNLIDMSVNSGRGEVIVKNKSLLKNTDEKIAVGKQCDSKGYWVVIHKALTNMFFSYNISAKGLDMSPTVSMISTSKTNRPEIGYMKFSPSGKWLVNANTLAERLEIFKFDKQSGRLEFYAADDEKYHTAAKKDAQTYYGVAFSSFENYFYVSTLEDGEIYQYNLLNQPSVIFKKRKLIRKLSNFGGAMQLGKDNRIYIANGYFGSYLHRINTPNSLGALCGFQLNAVWLGANSITNLGLPTLIETSLNYYNLGQDIIIQSNNGFKLDAKIQGGIYLWSTGETTKTIQVADTGGIYWVNVYDPNSCLYYTDTIRVLVQKDFKVEIPGLSNKTFCSNTYSDPIEFKTDDKEVTFVWFNDNTEIGLTEFGRGDIPSFMVPYYTSEISSILKVYPVKGGFIGLPVYFNIKITPLSVINPLSIRDRRYCSGENSETITFDFTANPGKIEWFNQKPEIGCPGHGLGTIQSFKCKAETETIYSVMRIVSFNQGCASDPSYFRIEINPTPVMEKVQDIEICSGNAVPFFKFKSNIESSKYYLEHPQYKGRQFEANSIPWFLFPIPKNNTLFEQEFLVYPKKDACAGEADTFNFKVKPSPTANFTTEEIRDDTGYFVTQVSFQNLSKDYTSFYWNIDGIGKSTDDYMNLQIATNKAHRVQLVAENTYDCVDEKVEYLTINRYPMVLIPNAVSPNGDGINDEFRYQVFAVSNYKLQIYNRWGEKVREEEMGDAPWDFKYAGNTCAQGVYTWKFNGTDLAGKTFNMGGTLQILK